MKECELCGAELESKRAKYCSDTCRQTAHRRRIGKGTIWAQRQGIKKGIETRAAQVILFTCAECGIEGTHTGLQGHTVYCSDACRQKAYRKRQKAVSD